jgi:hypothetical protein
LLIHNPYYNKNTQIVEDITLAKAVSDEKIVISTETACSNEKILERKTIVYETRVDPTVIKMTGEKLKAQPFTRFGFMKPKPEDIRLISIDKYYEPYMVISGKYVIDYYRKRTYAVRVDKKVLEVILLDHKFEPSHPADTSVKDHNVIKLEGEERLMIEAKASLLLDRFGQEATLKKLPSAPSERDPKKILAAFGVKEIPPDADLDVIRSKILRRPGDIHRLVNELFEVNERVVIYTPRFRLLYGNVRTGEEKAVELDGVTAERIQGPRPLAQFLEKFA